jgi:hypothetical protein
MKKKIIAAGIMLLTANICYAGGNGANTIRDTFIQNLFNNNTLNKELSVQDTDDSVSVSVDTWHAEYDYTQHTKITHNGLTYIAKWKNTGKEPGSTYVWKAIASWVDSASYAKGAEITYSGLTYIAKWNNTGKTPGKTYAWKQKAMPYTLLHGSEFNDYADDTSKNATIIRNVNDYKNELIKRTSAAIKTVNFYQETIVLIDMGPRNNGGDIVDVTFYESSDHVRANVVYSLPGEYCNIATVMTNPYKFIKLRTRKEILITEKIVSDPCTM